MRTHASPGVAVVAVAATLAVGVYAAAVLDALAAAAVSGTGRRWGRVFAAPARHAALLVVQRRGRTERDDAQAWALAPALLAAVAAAGAVVVPLGPRSRLADSPSGFVVFAAAVTLVMVAVFLHGWAPNSAFPLLGAYRFAAEALSYQIPFLLAMLATAIPAQSLAIGDIVESQHGVWNVVRQPLGLPLYLVVGVGVSFWGPLNLADGADLVGGTSAETSGVARLLWELARLAMLVALAGMGAAAFLGGWWGPALPGPVWMVAKTLILLALLVASRHVLARVRVERFVVVAWSVLVPLALLNVFVSGIVAL